LDAICKGFTVRFYACHWTSRFDDESSHKTRFRLADQLSKEVFQFLDKDRVSHHAIVLGDLNEEPFEDNLGVIYAHRHRSRSRARVHKADRKVERAHLYNTSWRLMGEKHAHNFSGTSTLTQNCAGTFFWESKKTWHHLDHIIVSGGLLDGDLPFLDEDDLQIVSSEKFLTDGLPLKFQERKGVYVGLSYHLPLVAKIKIS